MKVVPIIVALAISPARIGDEAPKFALLVDMSLASSTFEAIVILSVMSVGVLQLCGATLTGFMDLDSSPTYRPVSHKELMAADPAVNKAEHEQGQSRKFTHPTPNVDVKSTF